MAESSPFNERLATLTAQVVASYVGHNDIDVNDIPQILHVVYQGLSKLGQGNVSDNRPEPAVPPKKSIFPDYIVCLEDGKKLKMLKRHIKTSYNLTPEQYRERWNLGADYPMVAPNYAKQRSKLAKQIGLGTAPRRITRKAA